MHLEVPELPSISHTLDRKVPEKNIPRVLSGEVSLEVSIRPPIFSPIISTSILNDAFGLIIRSQVKLPRIPKLAIKTALFGTVVYEMENLGIESFHLNQNRTNFWFEQDRLRFRIPDIDISTTGDYRVSYAGFQHSGSSKTRTQLSIEGDYSIFLAERSELGMNLTKVATEFSAVQVSVSNEGLDWLLQLNQAIFSRVIRYLVSSTVSRIAQERITPLIENCVNSEIRFGNHSSKYKMVVLGHPSMTDQGIDLSLGMIRLP